VINRLGRRGDGIADAPAGPLYVPYALPGETAEVDPWPGHPDRRHLIKIDIASPDRIAPICPHFGICGGCALQQLATARYRDWKRGLVNEALAQDREHHGPEGIDTARCLAQLANAELRAHRFAEALPLIQHAAAIDQARLGPAHPFIADDLLDLGLVYDGLKQTEKARRAFAAAIDVLERGIGRDTPRVAYVELELARLDRQDGKDTEAEAAFKDARRILHKAEDEEHRPALR